jgi:hypothetical protein
MRDKGRDNLSSGVAGVATPPDADLLVDAVNCTIEEGKDEGF